MTSTDGFIQRWKTTDHFDKLNDGALKDNIDFRACQFLNDSSDQFKVILAGGDGIHSNLKVLNFKDE
jgi:hypothetical protein